MKKLIINITKLLKKYKSVISYLFFGVCTTVINVIVYDVSYKYLHIANIPSVIIAWFIAVAFAFITNKLFVFDSKTFIKTTLIKQILSFTSCRILTGLLEIVIMYIAVDLINGNPTLWKLLTNLIVIILNYVASKLIIFKK